MSDVVLIHGEAWKVDDIAKEVAWCRSVEWVLSSYANGDDHGHCSICWWTLAVSDDPEVGEGFVSGRHRWLCKECHEKFVGNA